MRTIIRIFVSLWFLLGWISHVYLGLTNPEMYRAFGKTALLPGYRTLWQNVVMPNITLFALLLAAFEIFVGVLLVNKGKWVKVGLVLSFLFNLFLLQMGLGYLTANAWEGFLFNRLANLVFMALLVYLWFGSYEHSIPEILNTWWSKIRR